MAVLLGLVQFSRTQKQSAQECRQIELLEELAWECSLVGHNWTGANAIDILKERFGNKQLIISSHMEALLKLKPVTEFSDIKGMRAVLDKVEIQVRGLQALGIE